jgi:hypothetical protein
MTRMTGKQNDWDNWKAGTTWKAGSTRMVERITGTIGNERNVRRSKILHYNEFIHESIFPLQYCEDISFTHFSLIKSSLSTIAHEDRLTPSPCHSNLPSLFPSPAQHMKKKYSSTIVVTSTNKTSLNNTVHIRAIPAHILPLRSKILVELPIAPIGDGNLRCNTNTVNRFRRFYECLRTNAVVGACNIRQNNAFKFSWKERKWICVFLKMSAK